jgi:PadR family transcriptional regulator PadR
LCSNSQLIFESQNLDVPAVDLDGRLGSGCHLARGQVHFGLVGTGLHRKPCEWCVRSGERTQTNIDSRLPTIYGSLPTMPDRKVVQGTLELLILRTLLFGPLHGHGIAKYIQRTSDDVLQVEHGSLYPALHRLEKSGRITSNWQETDRGREMRMYRLTARGRKQLMIEQSRWDELVRAMARVLKHV